MTTQTFTDTLVVVHCGADGCDVVFGMTERYYKARREDHQTWYCPNGHPRVYNGYSETENLRRRLKWAQESEQFYRDQAARERRSAAAQKGHRTRLLNLITRGICPVAGCRQTFENVPEHMAAQHPDFHEHEGRA